MTGDKETTPERFNRYFTSVYTTLFHDQELRGHAANIALTLLEIDLREESTK